MISQIIDKVVSRGQRSGSREEVNVPGGQRINSIVRSLRVIFSNDMAKVGGALFLFFLVMAITGPMVAPNDPDTRVTSEDGTWQEGLSPSLEYPLGTTADAMPLFSQIVVGTRIAFIVGISTGISVGIVGTTIGIVAGYYGGIVDQVFMRAVDTLYGIPFIPFAIVVVTVLGQSLVSVVFAMTILFWRSTARVVRSEVVTIKEQEMIDAARASGASNRRIILFHILPVVFPITILYSVFAIGWAILAEAGLAFLGIGTPASSHSWGAILNSATVGNALTRGMWLWIFAPGVCLVLFVMTAYFIGQGVEELANPELRTER
jgi:peptide/nickel transport system permease protein